MSSFKFHANVVKLAYLQAQRVTLRPIVSLLCRWLLLRFLKSNSFGHIRFPRGSDEVDVV